MADPTPQELTNTVLEDFKAKPIIQRLNEIKQLENCIKQVWKEKEEGYERIVSDLEKENHKAVAETERQKRPTAEMLKLLNIPSDEEKLRNGEYPDALSMIEAKPDSSQEEKFDIKKALADFEEFVKKLRTECEELDEKAEALRQIKEADDMSLRPLRIMIYNRFGIRIRDGPDGLDIISVYDEKKRIPMKTVLVKSELLKYYIGIFIWAQLEKRKD